ncbi:hypothetical protein [Streptomyces violaceusniger]|uniref:Uncharacterized protein n=1 Tax=Streptomyces violaceusniger (strain Tu 4113) TaxID=653045 RepID=G2PHF5_STRV4|nr:hypothetical protein [Streptomyces violaceusniger]AEM88801.1 hypothetical protein Strvi_0024 [Streptomyces violaceusniger Tu 4113]
MSRGVPGMAYVRPAAASQEASLRALARRSERHGALAPLQVVVLDNLPYWVVKDPDAEDGDTEIWFDALTGGRIAGPHHGGS